MRPEDPPTGDPQAALELAAAYREVKFIARRALAREGAACTVQTTVLAHEALLRLGCAGLPEERGHLQRLVSRVIRQVLVDHARRRKSQKRGQGERPSELLIEPPGPEGVPLADVLDLDLALGELAELDERQARVVELRFFGGLSVDETADALGVSARTVDGDWAMARSWLHRRLRPGRVP